tara:strand:- start:624 stop:1490 length:867 start_codon:yes stop_codon:yes gene_type:complete
MPDTSIIVPTYNSKKYAKQLCESILNQTFQNFEVIIVDNSSTDNTIETIKEISNNNSKFRYFSIRNDGVIGRSRNLGIKNSLSNYIAFHDSDDFWLKNKLEESLSFFPKYDLAYHNLTIKKYNRISIFKKKFNSYQLGENSFLELLTRGNPISTSGVICKKQLMINSKFSEEKRFSTIEDYDCWIKLSLKRIKFKEIKKCLGYYNLGDNNMSSNVKNNYQIFHIFNKYKKFLDKKNIYTSKNLFRYIAANQSKKKKYREKVFLFLIKSNFVKISKLKIFLKLIFNFFK